MRRTTTGILVTSALAAGVFLLVHRLNGGGARPADDAAETSTAGATFVGSETCTACHESESRAWQSSQHRHAMAHATADTVLGRFDGTTIDLASGRTRFLRDGARYVVETPGPGGTAGRFEVAYTFGVYPLQQYLVAFPDGRVQVLPFAWDARPPNAGGGRWFPLGPVAQIAPGDPLYWTNADQNWNHMCAECHSTGVRKGYDAGRNTFATSFAEISVGCEACHGEGSRHVAWARSRQPGGAAPAAGAALGLLVRFDERQRAAWTRGAADATAHRGTPPAPLRREVETCGRCHARRQTLSEDWLPGRPLSDTHEVSGIRVGLYEPDGQMRDEVYVYGSFRQSRMYAAGVTCSDCHDPHAGTLRQPGDATCLACHSASVFATPAHSHHDPAQATVSCVACHMPARTYMVVDPRRDHSFRIPRPDRTAAIGTPNACGDCHAGRGPEWAAAALARWFGPPRPGLQSYATAFDAAWRGRADAGPLLGAVAGNPAAPALARASALAELGAHPFTGTLELAIGGLADPDPLVRLGALDALAGTPVDLSWPIIAPFLSDPVRGVRIRAVSALAAMPVAYQPAGDRAAFDRAAGEFIAAQRLNADRPEARITLGAFFAARGRTTEAETEYRAALALDPRFTAAAINLADVYRETRRDADGERVLRAALVASPNDASLHHALGLVLARLARRGEARRELARAVELAPAAARYAYVYAIALRDAGDAAGARRVIDAALAHHADDPNLLQARAALAR